MTLETFHSTIEAIPVEPNQMTVSRPPADFWGKSAVAGLSALHISRMSNYSLMEVIELVQHYLPQSIVRRRLQLCDRVTLERLAYMARRICRNQGY